MTWRRGDSILFYGGNFYSQRFTGVASTWRKLMDARRISLLLAGLALTGSGGCNRDSQAVADAQGPKPPASNLAPLIQGSQDATNCSVIEGWALDRASPDRRLAVKIFDGDMAVATANASNFRADLVQAKIGDGKHSFSVPTPAALKDGKPHVLHIKEASTGTALPNGPKTITCSP
jgi:hypothetical protein